MVLEHGREYEGGGDPQDKVLKEEESQSMQIE